MLISGRVSTKSKGSLGCSPLMASVRAAGMESSLSPTVPEFVPRASKQSRLSPHVTEFVPGGRVSSHQFPAPNTEHIILNAWKKPVNQDSEHKRNPKKRNKTKRPKGEKSQEEIQKLTETNLKGEGQEHMVGARNVSGGQMGPSECHTGLSRNKSACNTSYHPPRHTDSAAGQCGSSITSEVPSRPNQLTDQQINLTVESPVTCSYSDKVKSSPKMNLENSDCQKKQGKSSGVGGAIDSSRRHVNGPRVLGVRPKLDKSHRRIDETGIACPEGHLTKQQGGSTQQGNCMLKANVRSYEARHIEVMQRAKSGGIHTGMHPSLEQTEDANVVSRAHGALQNTKGSSGERPRVQNGKPAWEKCERGVELDLSAGTARNVPLKQGFEEEPSHMVSGEHMRCKQQCDPKQKAAQGLRTNDQHGSVSKSVRSVNTVGEQLDNRTGSTRKSHIPASRRKIFSEQLSDEDMDTDHSFPTLDQVHGGSGEGKIPAPAVLSYSAVVKAPPKMARAHAHPSDSPEQQSGMARKSTQRRVLTRTTSNEDLGSEEVDKGSKKKRKKKKKTQSGQGDEANVTPSPSKRVNQPIQFDLGELLAKKIESPPKEKQNAKRVTVSAGLSPNQLLAAKSPPSGDRNMGGHRAAKGMDKSPHNVLDSTAPVVKRGKEKETPAKKKPTPLKKIILKERGERKNARLQQESQQPQGVSTSTGTEHVTDLNETEAEGERGGPEEARPSEDQVSAELHSRKFRDYCEQVLDKEVDQVVLELLQKLVQFQDRQYHKDPSKMKFKRRLVLGIKEVGKHLKLRRLKCVIMSSNVERIKSSGGLDEAVRSVIQTCHESDVPVIFALKRQVLGRALLKRVPVSIVGIFSYDGAQEQFKRLLELTERARQEYSQKREETVQKLVAEMRQNEAAASEKSESAGSGPNDGEEDEQLEVISLEGCDEEAELHEENTADGNDADSSGDDQQEADVAFRT